jgi:methylated-DNA-[protein]-cysteine S-methyltransferase
LYEAIRAIQPGQTRTYGQIAADLGEPGAARAVGRAMGQNPWPIIVPCHRVVAAGGKTGGFSAYGGVSTKLRLLAIEQAHRSTEGALF